MKRVICMLLVALLCMGLILPMMANAAEFVPSVTYKGNPLIVDADASWTDEDVLGCIVVTNVTQARQRNTDIAQEDRDILLEVYDALVAGESDLPLKEGYQIRELVDISFLYENCRKIPEHNNKHLALPQEDYTVTITFDMGLQANAELVVLTYIDGKWEQAEETVNNGDGTLTVTFEDLCPVAFTVKTNAQAATDNPNSGDPMARTMGLWIGLMALCAAGVVVLVVAMNRKRK